LICLTWLTERKKNKKLKSCELELPIDHFLHLQTPSFQRRSFFCIFEENQPAQFGCPPKKPMSRGEVPTTPMDFGQVSQYFFNGKFSPQSITRGGVVLVAQRHTHKTKTL
jgi:hypothetical protein